MHNKFDIVALHQRRQLAALVYVEWLEVQLLAVISSNCLPAGGVSGIGSALERCDGVGCGERGRSGYSVVVVG